MPLYNLSIADQLISYQPESYQRCNTTIGLIEMAILISLLKLRLQFIEITNNSSNVQFIYTVIPRFTVLLVGKQKCTVNRGHGKSRER